MNFLAAITEAKTGKHIRRPGWKGYLRYDSRGLIFCQDGMDKNQWTGKLYEHTAEDWEVFLYVPPAQTEPSKCSANLKPEQEKRFGMDSKSAEESVLREFMAKFETLAKEYGLSGYSCGVAIPQLKDPKNNCCINALHGPNWLIYDILKNAKKQVMVEVTEGILNGLQKDEINPFDVSVSTNKAHVVDFVHSKPKTLDKPLGIPGKQ